MEEPVVIVRRPIGPPPPALRLAAVLVVPLLLYALVATGQKAAENYQLNRQADALRTEIASLRTRNVQLQQEIEAARSDAAIEAIAREQLGLIKPGDHPLVVLAQDGAQVASPSPGDAAPAVAPQRPIWRQWWDTFFG